MTPGSTHASKFKALLYSLVAGCTVDFTGPNVQEAPAPASLKPCYEALHQPAWQNFKGGNWAVWQGTPFLGSLWRYRVA